MVTTTLSEHVEPNEWPEPGGAQDLGLIAQIAANSDSWGAVSAERHVLLNHPAVGSRKIAWFVDVADVGVDSSLDELFERGPSLTRSQGEVEQLFSALADQWEAETLVVSSPVEMAVHPAYQRIIGLGLQAVPLLLERLQRTKRYWFWALAAITGENPALGLGGVDDAISAWTHWGRANELFDQ